MWRWRWERSCGPCARVRDGMGDASKTHLTTEPSAAHGRPGAPTGFGDCRVGSQPVNWVASACPVVALCGCEAELLSALASLVTVHTPTARYLTAPACFVGGGVGYILTSRRCVTSPLPSHCFIVGAFFASSADFGSYANSPPRLDKRTR